jgi:hypothetical protein
MLSPDNDAQRAKLIEYHHGVALEGEFKALPPNTPITVQEALHFRSLPRLEDVYPTLEMAAYAGQTSGEILLAILGEARHEPNVASLERGIKMAGEVLKETRKASRTTLLRAWRQYDGVAHLHAAANLFRDDPDGFVFPCGPSTISDFLAVAEKLREAGEAFRPLKGQSTILDAARTWKVPPGIYLPEVLVNFVPKADLPFG